MMNEYLGPSSVEAYKKALLKGCLDEFCGHKIFQNKLIIDLVLIPIEYIIKSLCDQYNLNNNINS